MWPYLAFTQVREIQPKVLMLVHVLSHGAISQPLSYIFQVLELCACPEGLTSYRLLQHEDMSAVYTDLENSMSSDLAADLCKRSLFSERVSFVDCES